MKLALISMLVDYHQKNLHVIATSYYSQTLLQDCNDVRNKTTQRYITEELSDSNSDFDYEAI